MTKGWLERNKKKIVRFMFIIPIVAVAAISISHVVSWYDLANPLSWAVYLSIAVEIGAMSAIAATSVKIRGFSVWLVFGIVTLIQFIGNIFFCYSDIDVTSGAFADWVELTYPVFEAIGSDMEDVIAQRRWLAMLEGGLLPLISLTCLHFFIQYDEIDNIEEVDVMPEPDKPALVEPIAQDIIEEIVNEEANTTPKINIEPEVDTKSKPEVEAEEIKKSQPQKKTTRIKSLVNKGKKKIGNMSAKMKRIQDKNGNT